MRGAASDALIGTTSKASSILAPADRFVLDLKSNHPQAFISQGQNPKFNIYKQREQEVKVNQFPQTPSINIDSYRPPVLLNNGIAPLPNAGIFRIPVTYTVTANG